MKSVPTEVMQDKLLDWLLHGGFGIPMPATPFLVALFTTMPNTDTGLTGVEVVGGSYSNPTVAFSAPTNGILSNSGAIVFPTPTTDWGIVEGIGIYDSSKTFPMWFSDIEPIEITTGKVFRLEIGAIEIQVK